jgi:predicted dehydrogenase
MTTAPLRIGIVGCGRISSWHAGAIAQLPQRGRVVALADPDVGRAREVAAKFGVEAVYDGLASMLADPAVDAVVICTPNGLHADQSIAALESGRHVLVEKPMAENSADAERMAAAAVRTGHVLALGQTLRHTEPIRYVQDHRGAWGRLRAVEVSMCVRWNGPQAPWWATRTPQEGLILSLFAPHALDFVQLAVGGEPIDVHCETVQWQQEWRAEDEAMILLRYPDKVLANVHISYNQHFVVDRKTLHFEDAFVRIENGDDLWVNDRKIELQQGADTGVPAHQMGGRDLLQYFRLQFAEFAKAVHGEPARVPLHEEGVRLTRLIDRVIESGIRNSGTG